MPYKLKTNTLFGLPVVYVVLVSQDETGDPEQDLVVLDTNGETPLEDYGNATYMANRNIFSPGGGRSWRGRNLGTARTDVTDVWYSAGWQVPAGSRYAWPDPNNVSALTLFMAMHDFAAATSSANRGHLGATLNERGFGLTNNAGNTAPVGDPYTEGEISYHSYSSVRFATGINPPIGQKWSVVHSYDQNSSNYDVRYVLGDDEDTDPSPVWTWQDPATSGSVGTLPDPYQFAPMMAAAGGSGGREMEIYGYVALDGVLTDPAQAQQLHNEWFDLLVDVGAPSGPNPLIFMHHYHG